MVAAPAATMVVCYYFLFDRFNFQNKSQRMMYAGLAGIAAVQLITIAFVITAFNEKHTMKTSEKKDN